MGTLLGSAFRIALQVLAGMGLMKVADKVLPDKITDYQPISPTWTPFKVITFVITMVAGAMVLVFVGKKIGLKLK
jgi:hypothetical protein